MDGDAKTRAVVDTTPATPAGVPPTDTPATAEPTAAETTEASTEAVLPTSDSMSGEVSAPLPAAAEPMPEESAITTEPAPASGTAEPAALEAESNMPSAETLPETHEHTSIPSNAIELTNTAPGHTEVGDADLGEAGIEITRPEEPSAQPDAESAANEEETIKPVNEPPQVGSLGQQEDKMDIDEPEVEKGEAPEEDVGLVMGEMAPPVGQEGLKVTDQDQVKEAEEKASEGDLTPPPS